MEQELTLTLIEPRPVTSQDVIDFNEAVPQRLGYTFVPVAVISEYSNIGNDFKEYFAIGTVVSPEAKPELWKILIKRVVYPGAKWEVVSETKILTNQEDVNTSDFDNKIFDIKPLGEDEPEKFYSKYPQLIGATKEPICLVIVGEIIGGKTFYLAKVTIMNAQLTSYYKLLPY